MLKFVRGNFSRRTDSARSSSISRINIATRRGSPEKSENAAKNSNSFLPIFLGQIFPRTVNVAEKLSPKINHNNPAPHDDSIKTNLPIKAGKRILKNGFFFNSQLCTLLPTKTLQRSCVFAAHNTGNSRCQLNIRHAQHCKDVGQVL